MANRDFKGVWIPREIYLDDSLSWTEKILLVEIDSLDQGEGCYASNKYFADFLDITEGRVANMISKLRKDDLVVDRSFDGRKRYISVKAGFTKKLRQGSRKSEGWVHEKVNEFSSENQNYGSVKPQNTETQPPINTVNNKVNTKLTLETTKFNEETIPCNEDGEPLLTGPKKKTAAISSNPYSVAASLITWAESEMGHKFTTQPKQRAQILNTLKAGYSEQQIKDCWVSLMQDPFWAEKGFDFSTVSNQISKAKGQTKKRFSQLDAANEIRL